MEINPTNSASSTKPDRKTIEKNRRNEMKNLFTHLNSLLPRQDGSFVSRDNVSLPERIDEATKYIKKLQAHLERLKEKKNSLAGESSNSMKSTQIEIHVSGESVLQVVLLTGVDCQFVFTEAIRIIHDEGAEVVNASFNVMDDTTVFHTIHAKMECSEREVAVARITERLNRFCN